MPKRKPKKRRGDCFQVHANFVLELGEKEVADLRVCHGLVFHRSHGHHAHSWIEVGKTCLDMSNGLAISTHKDRYYAVGRIKSVKRYTATRLRNKVLEHENYGPWHLPGK
jgi:hypothetical protein